jgi:FkbM family methyltransferase
MADYRPYDIELNGERWLIERLTAGDPSVLFDVGANRAEWSRIAHRILPRATIHAFEIVPETFAILKANVLESNNIVANPFGLADRDGEIEIHSGGGGSPHSSIVPDFVGRIESTRRCRVMTGDSYMRERNIERIDLLKMDVEGSEHLVLAGLQNAIGRGAIDVVQFEYGRINIITHFLLYDFYRLLEGAGYAVGQLNPTSVEFKPYSVYMETWWPPNWIGVRRDRPDIIEMLRA